MTKEEKKKRFCSSCRNNFYNGNNPSGVKECWSLPKSRIVSRVCVGIWEPPPYYKKPQKTLDCHHFESVSTWILPTDPRVKSDKKKELA